MKEEILRNYKGQYCTIDDIVGFVERMNGDVSRKTVIWNVNELVRQGKAVRYGRGVYGFVPKPRFVPVLSELAKLACSMLYCKFKYLTFTVTDSGELGEFMNLQPFSTVVVIETKKSAAGAVLSALRKEGMDAYAKRDFSKLERYISSSQPIVVRPELAVNPSMFQENNIRVANLEKILVDLVCDQDIYGQYQDEELQNIYINAAESYAVNYSQMLKYASARKRKAAVLELLEDTDVYSNIKGLI